MHILREYINSLGPPSRRLTERDAAMLVIAAGRRAGFTVRTEVSVNGQRPSGLPGRGEIDVGWYRPDDGDAMIVAWEIDGRNAPNGHFQGILTHDTEGRITKDTLGNVAKFNACGAIRKIQVLYSLKNDLELKPQLNPQIEGLLPNDVSTYDDEALMAPNGIENLSDELLQLL